VFEQSPNTHIQNHGCPLCGQHKSSISNRYTTEEFVARAKLSHDEKYDYSKVVYKTEHENIVISCPIHKEFEQTPNNHLYGLQGCPKCTSRVSKPETLWLDYLNIPVRQHSIKTTIRKILVDGYDPETNTVYQFHGNYWHGNPDVFDPNEMNKTTKCTFKELYDKTQETDQLIRESGYNLVVIWEKDWRQLTTKME
jgi:Zn finger protein HypA/HybF involved in hydrogenase expression